MPTTLAEAYADLTGTLLGQRQGTCGLYSFWFATLLIKRINPGDTRNLVYPRKWEGGKSGGESLRHYSKTLGSGQGEILTLDEMEKVIRHFGWDCVSHLGEGRVEFITKCLAANQPVLFPYMFGPGGPISYFPPNTKPGEDYGPHWSLIIAEAGHEYDYIEPNFPNTLVTELKWKVLKSNAFVDKYKYERYWMKNPWGGQPTKPPYPAKHPKKGTQWYDIGDKSRQVLEEVLVAVV
jgi:hypothetical protein